MRIEEISAWEAFHGVAVHGGFSKAARSLRVSVPQLSKRVARLESDLGVRLFKRSTRVVALTDEGKSLFPKVSTVLSDLGDLESSFEAKQALSGVIRVTAVPFLAQRLLIPVFSKFTKAHPNVNFELELSETMVNLVEANMDLALRIHNEPKDTSLVYRKLFPNELILCASPAYLKKAPPLKRVADLKAHKLLVIDVHRKTRFLSGEGDLGSLAVGANFHCNNGWFMTELALKGFGVLVRSRLDVQEFLEKGTLVQVLEKSPLEPFGNVYAVIPNRKFLAPRVRAFYEMLVHAA